MLIDCYVVDVCAGCCLIDVWCLLCVACVVVWCVRVVCMLFVCCVCVCCVLFDLC